MVSSTSILERHKIIDYSGTIYVYADQFTRHRSWIISKTMEVKFKQRPFTNQQEVNSTQSAAIHHITRNARSTNHWRSQNARNFENAHWKRGRFFKLITRIQDSPRFCTWHNRKSLTSRQWQSSIAKFQFLRLQALMAYLSLLYQCTQHFFQLQTYTPSRHPRSSTYPLNQSIYQTTATSIHLTIVDNRIWRRETKTRHVWHTTNMSNDETVCDARPTEISHSLANYSTVMQSVYADRLLACT